MKTRLLHLIFCLCVFHLSQVQSYCKFIHTDGEEKVLDDKNCFCGPEKIIGYNTTTKGFTPTLQTPNENYSPLSVHSQLNTSCIGC